ncbi:MAG: MBOAT family O-acyltransferase [Pseudobacter sp.]|uniref:MBOAT family O-acyltransferase n=1 Tax=Pseudobacter sp. TaxID=2045420 RepID=UPI003F7D3E98
MLFNSLQFLIFFLVITLAYYQLPNQKGRTWLLLLASCYFYMAFVPKYILILGATIVIDYFAGLQIAKSNGKARRNWMLVSIVANVGILVFYKYFNFIFGNLEPLLQLAFPDRHMPVLDILLPIGLSFHTFQAMSYIIEVYRGNQPPERNFITYALYVMFYPQLVAGPIERPQNVLPQLHEYHTYNWNNVKEGLSRMLWGMFKKVVIADRLAIAVDHAFGHTDTQSSAQLAVAAVFYSFQIYCDFSGYSDIGIGAAKVMGIRLMENFKEPYRAGNIQQFWSRWHISLSTWFRDYVYIPLGGNRLGEARRKLNVMIVFLLSGLWHGANWTFVIWGGMHGVLTAFLPGRKEDGMHKFLSRYVFVGINFLLVTLLWIFFRAPGLSEAVTYIKGIASVKTGTGSFGLNMTESLLAVGLIAVMLFVERKRTSYLIERNWLFLLYALLMATVCYLLGVFNENQFIYFQF